MELGGLVLAVIVSLIAAVALWYFVERPSHLWSKKFASMDVVPVDEIPDPAPG